jgi:hypothetical protein
MDELRRTLAALDPEQVRLLLRESGHEALVPVPLEAHAETRKPNEKVDVPAIKAVGNAHYKAGQFEAAVAAYSR